MIRARDPAPVTRRPHRPAPRAVVSSCRAALAIALATWVAGACTTFAFPAPGAHGPDASTDASTDASIDAPSGAGPDAETGAGDDAGSNTFLATDDAAKLCALLFECPGLAEAIELSLVVPLATPSVPNFSACMDWLDAPVDPKRVGLVDQQLILAEIASQTTCAGAASMTPVRPVALEGGACATACSGDVATTCSAARAFSFTCGLPLFKDNGACTLAGADAVCITPTACAPTGLSCRDTSTLQDCYPGDKSHTAYDCSLSGRRCASGAPGTAACVIGGSLAPPCTNAHALFDGCNGNSVRHCAGDLLAQTEFDCSAVDRECSTASGGAARCRGANDVCTPFDDSGGINTCSVSTITMCVGGVKTRYDCSRIGLSCLGATPAGSAHCGAAPGGGP
jgi:hypothetical protein